MFDNRVLGRFRKDGEAPPTPPAIAHRQKAAELRAKNPELDRRAAEMQAQIDALAFELVENPTPELERAARTLEADKAEIATLKRRNEQAAREHDRLAAEAADADAKRRKVALYKEICSTSSRRNRFAKDAMTGLEQFAWAVGKIVEHNDKLNMMIPGDKSRAGTGTGKDTFMHAIMHAMLLAGRKHGFAMPGGRYSNADFKDLATFIANAHAVVAERFSDAAARGVRSLAETTAAIEAAENTPREPEPVPAAEPEQIMVLTGRAYQRAIDEAAAQRPAQASDVSIDPFTGEPL